MPSPSFPPSKPLENIPKSLFHEYVIIIFFQRREKKICTLQIVSLVWLRQCTSESPACVRRRLCVLYAHSKCYFSVLYLLLHVWASSALAGKTVRTNIYFFLWCSSSRFKWFLSSRKMLKNIQKYYPTSTTFYYISKHKVVVFFAFTNNVKDIWIRT